MAESMVEGDIPLFIRPPSTDDGWGIYELIKSCPPLDVNSTYAYLLLATQFRDRCAVATTSDGEIVGFVSGYVKTNAPDTYFLWQVAVGEKARGKGMARRLVEAVLKREHQADVRHLETTITPDNEASWGLFRRLATRWQAPLNSREYFSEEQLGGEHDPENLVRIGPFDPQNI
ncbi:diaminobutyrate acetyltransferase [Kushneria sinocarnis]|uniref:L-2,4-diaminobutyric acid acetyltransferase n=2 Tax=Kushneria sinocarnis TaxID=595502 RepID=A0A420WYC5_9GAMM|nr:diaminobutyrate acetyltransferase [Kushneria sinocarnis]